MSSQLSAADLTYMRETLETLLPDTCLFYSPTNTPDGQGGGSVSWALGGTAICRLDNNSGNRQTIAQSVLPASSWTLTVPQGTGLDTSMQIDCNGNTYTVSSVASERSWEIVERATLERVE